MRKVGVGKTLLVAGACALIPLIGNVVASFLTEWTGSGSWLVVPVVGVVVAMVTALVQAYSSTTEPTAQFPNPYPGQPPVPAGYPYRLYKRQERPGTPLALTLLIAFLVLGVGGFGVAAGVRYAVGYITGNEPGTDRLVRPATTSDNGLTLTVVSVTYTAHFTRVGLEADNETGTALSLPLFGNCVFEGSDRTTLEADPARSRWPITVAPGSRQRGTIIFKDHLPDSVTRASLRFAHTFGSFEVDSISVSDIMLRPG